MRLREKRSAEHHMRFLTNEVAKITLKTKPLLPSLREKKRYITFEVISDNKIKEYNAIVDRIIDEIKSLKGSEGLSRAGIVDLPSSWDKDNQRGIIRVSAKSANEVKAAFCLIDNIGGEKVIVRSVTTSGMLKNARKHIQQQKRA